MTLSTLIVSLHPATPRNKEAQIRHNLHIYLILSVTDPGMHEPQKWGQTCNKIELPWELWIPIINYSYRKFIYVSILKPRR
jgi:hypothetical protein